MASSIRKFRWDQVFFQWSVGMLVSTPLIAVFQGTLLLSNYRTNFRDLPRPIMPARGVTVSVEHDDAKRKKNSPIAKYNNQSKEINTWERPLRLLVVGDSLAAGVGISKSGIPVLPESIARALSKAYGGRAVYWTCVGTPGISASQIIQDINQIEPLRPRRLEKLLEEWQAKRRKWQQLQDLKEKQKGINLETRNKGDDKKQNETINIEERIQNWWTKRISQIKEAFLEIKEIILEPTLDIDDKAHNHDQHDKNYYGLVKRGSLFRRDSVDPEIVSQYDVTIVLLGLNDLKDAFIPHMTTGSDASTENGTEKNIVGLNAQLHGVLQALRRKMGEEASKNSSVSKHFRQPLVVVPELPVLPLECFSLYPLCWFLIPLFKAMESNKKFLSFKFPNDVVFVHQPDLKWWLDAEAGLGPMHENLNKEESLLRLTDIAQAAQNRVQQLMKKRRYSGNQAVKGGEGEKKGLGHHHPHDHSDHHVEKSEQDEKKPFSFIAVDKMHPNDEGYEIWGVHIAAAVVRHWKRGKG